MAQKVGSAEIQVHPNFRQFHNKLKAGIQDQKKNGEAFDLPVDADLDKFKERMQEVERIRKSEERNPIQIAIELKTADAIRELRTFRALADDMSDIDTKIHVDRSELEGAGEEFMNLETIFGGGLETYVDIDRTELDDLNRDLQRARISAEANPIHQRVIVTQDTLRSPSLEAGVRAGMLVGAFTALGVGAAGATPAIAAFGSALSSTTGTLLVLPSMVTAAGASFAALSMAVSGVGEAMGGLAGKAKEGVISLEDFDEATENLSDSAKEFNRTLFMTKGGADSLYDGFQNLKLLAQESMFKEVNKGLEVMEDRLRSVNENGIKGMLVLGRHLSALSSDMGNVAENWAKFRFSDQGWADLNLQLLNIRGAMVHIVGAMDRWNVAWNNLSTVGSAYLPDFTRWIRGGADAFAEWTTEARRTGDMVRIIDNGIRSAKNIGSATAGIFRIMGDVFEAAGVNARDMASRLKEGTQALEDFTSSTSGQASMIKFFREAQTVGSEMTKTLMEIGRVIAVHVTPLVSEFILGFGPKFRESIGGSTSLLSALEGSMFKLGEAFGNFFIGLNTFGEFMAPIVESTLPLLADGFKSVASAIGALAGPTTTLMILKMTVDGLKPFLANFGLLFAGPNGLTRKFYVFGTAATVLVGVFDDILGMVVSLNDALGGMPAKITGFALLLNKIPDSFKIWERVRPAEKIQAIGSESTKATGAIAGFNQGTQGSYRGVAILTRNLDAGRTAFRNYTSEMRAVYRNQMTSVQDLRALAASPIGPSAKANASLKASSAHFRAYKDSMVTGLKQVGSAAGNASRNLANAFGGPWVLGISAAIGAIAGVHSEMKQYEEHLKAVDQYSIMAKNSSKEMFQAISEGSSELDAAQASLDNMRSKLQDVSETGPGKFKRFTQYTGILNWDEDGEFTEQRDTADNAKRAIEAIDALGISNEELARKVTGSKREWNSLQADLRKVEGGEHAIAELQKQRDAADNATEAVERLGPAYMEASRLFDEVASSGGEASGSLQKVSDAMRLLEGQTTPAKNGTAELTKELDMLSKRTAEFEGAMVKANGELDMTNPASVALSEELYNLGEAMRRAVEDGEPVNEVFSRSTGQLNAMKDSAGLTDEQWQDLLDSMRMTPETVQTDILVKTSPAMKALAEVRSQIENMPDGETEVKLGEQTEDTRTFLENMGFKVKSLNGELVIDMAESSSHAKALLDEIFGSLTSISQERWEAIISAPGGEQTKLLIQEISGQKITSKNVTVNDVGGQEMYDLLINIGLLKVTPKGVVVNDDGGRDMLNILRELREAPDSETNHTVRYITHYSSTGEKREHREEYWRRQGKGKNTQGPVPMAYRTGGRYPGYAAGDRHRGYRLPTQGPGTGVTDGFMAQDSSGVPVARLDEGEWIINGRMSEEYNRELAAINAGTFPKLPGYAAGRGIGAAIGAGKNVLTNLLSQTTAAQGAVGDVFAPVATAWDQTQATLTEAWSSFASLAQTSWESVEQGILGPWTNTNTSLTTKWMQTSEFLNSSWLTFQAQTNAIWTSAQAVITSQWSSAGNNVMSTVNSLMRPAFSLAQSGLEVTRGAFQSAVAQINPTWTGMGSHVQNIVTGTVIPTFQTMQSGLSTLEGWVGTTVNNIGTAWGRIQAATAKPARFVIESVFNGGLRNAWNAVAELIDEPELKPVGLGNLGGYATGGVLPGYTPGKDVHRFHSATGGTLDLSGGEAIMRPEWTRAVGGPAAVEQMNAAARSGKLRKKSLNDPKTSHGHAHYANGGVWGTPLAYAQGGVLPGAGELTTEIQRSMMHAVARAFPNQQITSGTRYVDVGSGFDNHMQGRAIDFAPSQALAQWIAKTYPNTLELIHAPENGFRNIWHGNPHSYDGPTMAGHYDHVHWAMSSIVDPYTGKVVSMSGPGDGAGAMSMASIVGPMWDDEMDKVKDYSGPTSKFADNILAMKDKMVSMAWDYVAEKAGAMGADAGGLVSLDGVSGSNREMGKQMAERAGWTGGQWTSLDNLWTKESGWNHLAQNPTSTAFGIPQFLDTTWAEVGIAKTSDPKKQIQAGIKYIQGRYGDANAAWAHSVANNWYDRGGEANGKGVMQKNVLEPERVLSPNQTRAFNDFVYKFLPTLIADFRRRPFSIQEGVNRVVRELRGLPAKQAGYREKSIAAMTDSLAGKFSDRIAGKPRANRLDSNYDADWFNRNGGKLQTNISQAIAKGSLAASDPWGYLAAEEAAKERIEEEKEAAREKAKEEEQAAKQEAETKRQEARQAERDKLTEEAGDNEDALKALEEKFDEEDKALQDEQAKADEIQQAKDQAESERIQKLKDSGEYYYGYKVFANDGANPNEYERPEQEQMALSAGVQLSEAFGFEGGNKLAQRIGMIQSLGSAVQTAIPAWVAAANGDTTGYAHNVAVGTSLALDDARQGAKDLAPSLMASGAEMLLSTASLQTAPLVGTINSGMTQAELLATLERHEQKAARKRGGTPRRL